MDEKNYENMNNGENSTEDMDKTQEMESLQSVSDDTRVIMPKGEFIENNAADDMSKTLLMDSMPNSEPLSDRYHPQNEVKRRRKKKPKKQINHTRTMGHIFLGVVISVTALGLGIFLAVNVIRAMIDFTGMAKPAAQAEVEITDITGIDDITKTLHDQGIIELPWLFKTYVRLTDSGSGFLNGNFTIFSNMSYNSIIETLKTPKVYTSTVTVFIPEGLTAADVGKILEENLVCRAVDFEKFYKEKLNKYDFEESIEPNEYRLNMLEGYIFPDTYEFYVIDDMEKFPNFDTTDYAKDAADTMYRNFESKITKSMKARMKELDLTLDEVVILASLVQWEGNDEESWAKISSVFHNRRADPEEFPHLQSDTTYTYIKQCIKPITNSTNAAKMKRIEEAYDTYTCYDLPAGAVCNPGLDAINAVLYPADTDYYYFLASKDGNFYYARTLEQHEQNILDADLHADDED